jgi:hypothetical protein
MALLHILYMSHDFILEKLLAGGNQFLATQKYLSSIRNGGVFCINFPIFQTFDMFIYFPYYAF